MNISNITGIILFGGNGIRLKPLTTVVNKHLLPIYNKTLAQHATEFFGSLVIRVTQPDKSCIQRVPLEVKIYALEQMFDV